MPKDEANQDEPITLTRAELTKLLDEREAESKMDPQERKLRAIIGDVVDSRLRGFFDEVFDDAALDEGKRPGGRQAPGKGKPKGLLDGLVGALTGEGEDEDDK